MVTPGRPSPFSSVTRPVTGAAGRALLWLHTGRRVEGAALAAATGNQQASTGNNKRPEGGKNFFIWVGLKSEKKADSQQKKPQFMQTFA
ncbi:hypothetical protein GCM10027345_34920 [Hymenobacter daeguensis]